MAGDIGNDDESLPGGVRDALANPPAYRAPYDDDSRAREFKEDAGYYGIMYAGDYKWDNRKCTREAYGDDRSKWSGRGKTGIRGQQRRSLAYHSEWMPPAEAVDCVREIPQYNTFTPDVFEQFLEDVVPVTTRVVIGRESSPVVYLWTGRPVFVVNQLAGLRPQPDSPASLPDWARDAAPDELGAVPRADHYPVRSTGKPRDAPEVGRGVPTLIRAWWD